MMDFTNLKTIKRRNSPNNYLVGPATFFATAQPDQTALSDAPARDLYAAVVEFAKGQRSWDIIASDPDGRRLKMVATTSLLRFKDDVDIEILEVETGSAPVIYSRSRVGYSDLGANRKRVESILAVIQSLKVKA